MDRRVKGREHMSTSSSAHAADTLAPPEKTSIVRVVFASLIGTAVE